jgi:hypothetical protein
MRKFILGFVMGALIFSGVTAFAGNVSLVGMKVGSEAELYIDGKQLSDVIVVDNKSFAPVREFAESLGRNVEYKKAEKGDKAVINIRQLPNVENIKLEIKTLEEEISLLNMNAGRVKETRIMQLKYKNPDATDEEIEALLLKDETYMEDFNARSARIAEIEKELAELEARKAELEQ